MPQKTKVGRAPTLKELPADALKDHLATAYRNVDAAIHGLKLDVQNRRWADVVQGQKDLWVLLGVVGPVIDEVRRRLERG